MGRLEIEWHLAMQNYFCRDNNESPNPKYHRATALLAQDFHSFGLFKEFRCQRHQYSI